MRFEKGLDSFDIVTHLWDRRNEDRHEGNNYFYYTSKISEQPQKVVDFPLVLLKLVRKRNLKFKNLLFYMVVFVLKQLLEAEEISFISRGEGFEKAIEGWVNVVCKDCFRYKQGVVLQKLAYKPIINWEIWLTLSDFLDFRLVWLAVFKSILVVWNALINLENNARPRIACSYVVHHQLPNVFCTEVLIACLMETIV